MVAWVLGALGDTRAVAPLIAALEDSDHDVRVEVARVLGALGDTRAVAPLFPALEDSDHDVRVEAARALGALGDSRAVGPLIAALTDSNEQMRAAAVVALDHLDDPRAVEALVAALRDPAPQVSSLAREALKRFGSRVGEVLQPTLTGDPLSDLPTLRTLADLGDKGGINGLLAIIEDTSLDDDTRSATATYLRRRSFYIRGKTAKRVAATLDNFRSDPAALSSLIDEFMDIWPDVIVSAGSALAEQGDKALEPLLLALGDHDMLARYQTVRPMTHDEAKELVLALTRERLERLERLREETRQARDALARVRGTG
jgi:HEAT repeat protein